MTTTNLGLPELVEGQASAEVTVNETLARLDMLVQAAVKDRNLTAPPGGEANGDVYLVATGATGDWAGHDGELAGYYDGYIFATVKEGWIFRVLDENVWLGWDGAAYKTFTVT